MNKLFTLAAMSLMTLSAMAQATYSGHIAFVTEGAVINPPVASAVDYQCIANADNTLTVNFNIANESQITGIVNPELYIDNHNVGIEKTEGTYKYTKTTTETFTVGEAVPGFRIGLVYAGARTDINLDYIFGQEGQQTPAEVKPTVVASVKNVTFNSAEIEYNVVLPADIYGADVKVTVDGETATESPYLLTGLSESTQYVCQVVAIATLDGKEYTSDPVEVTFNTISKDARDYTATGTASGVAEGELNDNKFSYPYTIDYTITYLADGHLRFTGVYNVEGNMVGLVPQIMINGPYKGNLEMVDGVYTFTTSDTYTMNDTLQVNFFMAYAGGACSNMVDYVVGQEGSLAAIRTLVSGNGLVDVYTATGMRVASKVNFADVKASLAPGLYIVGGKKVMVK